MKRACVLAAALAAPAAAESIVMDNSGAAPASAVESRKWKMFLSKFNRKYSETEKDMRFAIFRANLKRIEGKNKNSHSTFYSFLTPYADWTESEFQSLNRMRVSSKTKKWHAEGVKKSEQKVGLMLAKAEAAPTSFDWRGKGFNQKVQDQGQCGSCWSFATVANIEGVHFAHSGAVIKLSEQQLVDCDPEDHGCNGGLPQNADDYLITKHMGLEKEADYPYTGSDKDTCHAEAAKEKIFISSILHIDQDEGAMARALVAHGPLAIGINATPMQWYTGGVSQPDVEQCDPEALNHGVALVGFGVDDDAQLNKQWEEHRLSLLVQKAALAFPSRDAEQAEKTSFLARRRRLNAESGAVAKSVPFWVIRNSWGPLWGEEGHYRIMRGSNACGLTTLVTTAEGTDAKSVKDSAVHTSSAAELPEIWM